jgi:hypothetical protein
MKSPQDLRHTCMHVSVKERSETHPNFKHMKSPTGDSGDFLDLGVFCFVRGDSLFILLECSPVAHREALIN